MSKITLLKTDSTHPDFKELTFHLDVFLKKINQKQDPFVATQNPVDALSHVIIAYVDSKAVGCGAFKPFSEKEAEIKRMFVLPEYQKQGFARKILKNLEYWAEESNFDFCILETNSEIPNALNLLQKAGYVVIKNYGPYKDVPGSLCMKKWISEI